jgi:lysophospholipase L1-like esterase
VSRSKIPAATRDGWSLFGRGPATRKLAAHLEGANRRPGQKPIAVRLLPLALVLVSLAGLVPAAAATRFMPTGDSITQGTGSTDNLGFRPRLYTLLNGFGSYDFVGPSGTSPHEGYFDGALRVENFLAGGNHDLEPVVVQHDPEVLAIHLGTNDVNSYLGPYAPWSTDHSTPTTNPSGDLGALVDYALNINAGGVSRVVVSRVVPIGGREEDIRAFNREVVRLVLDYRNGAVTGTPEPVTLADHYRHFLGNPDLFSGGPGDWMDDYLHPNDAGYEEMANVYFAAVREASSDTDPPDPVDDLAVATVSGNSALLVWTNTGDDGFSGDPAYADARYATGSITPTSFKTQAQGGDYEGIGDGGALTGTRLAGLSPATNYTFALKLMDDAGNLSALSTTAAAATTGDPTTYRDTFTRAMPAPGPDWDGPVFIVDGAELENTALDFAAAVFTAVQNAASVEITWGAGADATGINQAGLACRLEGTNPATTDGYLVYRNTGTNHTLSLRELIDGQPGTLIQTTPAARPAPQAGDRFQVVLTSDVSGHHFAVFLNGAQDGVLHDPLKRRGNGDFWCGVVTDGRLNNNIAAWILESTPINLPPAPFNLTAPANGVLLTNLNPYFDWQVSADPNGDPVTYTLLLSTDPAFPAELTTEIGPLSASFYAQGEPLLPNRTYHWRVVAEDPQGASTISNSTRSFSTDNLQQLGDDFERQALGPDWAADPSAYVLANGELDGVFLGYNHIAVYRPVPSPVSVEWQWSETSSQLALGQAGCLLGLDGNLTTASGYFVFRNSVGAQRWGVFAVINGALAGSLTIDQPGRGPLPVPGDKIRVVLTKTASAHIFDCYVNDVFDARMTDSQRQYGTAPVTYSGLLLGENTPNNVESFAAMGQNLNLPPAAFALLEPTDGERVYSLSPLLRWEAASDPNPGDLITYTVIYDTDPGFVSPDSLAPTTGTEATYTGGLATGQSIYWRVVAEDAAGATVTSTQTWSFQFAPILTFVDDFNRALLGPNWSGDTNVMKIVSDELKNTAGSTTFDIAVYAARSNPDAAEFTWSPTANNDGIFRGGLALRLNNTSGSPSGYLVRIDPVANQGKLEEIRSGARGFPITSAPGQTAPPGPRKRFKVALSSDAAGHHFDVYVDGTFHSRLTDPDRRQGNGAVLYAGAGLYGQNANSVDDFTLTAFNFGPPPASFALLVPAHQDTGVTTAPAFRWRAAGEPGLLYTVFVGTDSTFAACDSVAAVTDTTLTWPQSLLLATNYVWRVRATDGQATSFNQNGWHRFRTTAVSAVEIASFAASGEAGAIRLAWVTASETDHLGFHVWRADEPDAPPVRLTGPDDLVTGRSLYAYVDLTAAPGRSYAYWIEAVGLGGETERFGPVVATALAPALELALHRITPNPTAAPAILRFDLPAPAAVRLLIFDASGRTVREVVNSPLAAGRHAAVWDGRNASGNPAGSGVYFARLEVGTFRANAKLLLMR